ncbi:MAG: discoidin domain-containing protein [Oscillochloris sp.]|nr:discoidin domain-containing protein [Oscillochloris sp.]
MRHLIVSALLILVGLLPAHVAGQSVPPVVRVDAGRPLTLNGPFRGLGAQDDSNMLWSGPNRAAGAQVPHDFQQIVAPRLRALHMPLVRKFVDVAWFAPEPGVYAWDSPAMQGLIANLLTHQANGSTVMLTIWSIPRWLSADPRITRDTELKPAADFPSPGTNPDYEQRWANVVADLLRHLYGLDGSGLNFSNIAYLGGPNEPIYFGTDRLVRPFNLLRANLEAAGLADHITLFGPDAFVEELPAAINTPGLDPLLGAYTFHFYAGSAAFEPGLIAALDRLRTATAPTGKQLWLTEFGEVDAKNDDWRNLPIGAIAAINGGAAAALMWNTQDQIYNTDNIPAWGLWEVYDTDYRLKPAFYAWQIMARHLPESATVYGHSCDRAQCPDLRMAVLANATQRAVIALNLSDRPLPLQVDLGPLAGDRPLQRYLLDPADLPKQAGPGLPTDRTLPPGQLLADSLPAGALAVYSDGVPILPPSRTTGGIAAASSQESAELAPYYAIDNDPHTRWSSRFADGEWLTIDLGARQRITSVQIQWEAAYARAYELQHSSDGRTWRTVQRVTAGSGGLETLHFPPQDARYLRIAAMQRATPFGVSIWEVAIW